MSRAFLFALLAALNPTLLTATTVMLLLPNPRRLMLGYLAGALTTGMIVGIAIVGWLSNSGAVSETKRSVSPVIDIALGLVALIGAYVIQSGRVERERRRREEKRANKPTRAPRWQQALSKGSAKTTYLIGLLLSFPGAAYLTSLTAISKLDLSSAEIVLTVLAVNAVMLVLLEAPLIAFTVAPDWTPVAIERFRAWAARHGARALTLALTVIGAMFVVRGTITIITG